MGNQQSQIFEWENQYNVLQRNFNDNTLVVQKKGTDVECLGREIICTDKKQSQEIKRLIEQKHKNTNPFITKLLHVYFNKEQVYCSPEYKIYFVFDKPIRTLRQEILERKFSNESFSQEQADIILQAGVKAIRYLKQMKHPHNNVSSSSIFIDNDRRIILGDPWITPPILSQDISQNVFACPSPEKILLQNDQILSICPYMSDLFSLGTVILEVLHFQYMDTLYEKGFRKVLDSKVKERLCSLKDDNLRYKLSIVLSHNPQSRQQIYSVYRNKKLSRQQIKNRNTISLNNQNTNPNRLININKPIQPQIKNKPILYQNQHGLQQKPIHNTNHKTVIDTFQKDKINHFIPKVYNQLPNNGSQTVNYSKPTINTIYPQTIPNHVKFQNYPINPTNNHQVQYGPINHLSTNMFPIKIHHQQQRPTNIIRPNQVSFFNHQHPSVQNQQPQLQQNVLVQQKELQENIKIQKQLKFPNEKDLAESHSSINQSINNFQPVLITSAEDFVKTSRDVRFGDQTNQTINKSKSKEDFQERNSQNIDTPHIGNYNIREVNHRTPVQSFDLKQVNESNIHQKTVSENSDRLFLDSITETQNIPINFELQNSRETPQRKPTRKYNSTIKQDPNESSESKDEGDQLEFVIQEYEAGRYEGNKRNGKRNGFGKFYYQQGSVYEGQWKDNLMHGKGNLYYANGKIAYEGTWNQDQFHGYGKVCNEDQIIVNGVFDFTDLQKINQFWVTYQGQLNCDRKHGKGKIKYTNGQIFSGNFVNDIIQGQGKFYNLIGEIIHGIWKKNKLIKKF